MTGEAFAYAVDGQTFTLTARPYDPGNIHSGARWTVTLRND
jgi:hypothetical protein